MKYNRKLSKQRKYIKYKDMDDIHKRFYIIYWVNHNNLNISQEAFEKLCLLLDKRRINKDNFFIILRKVVFTNDWARERFGTQNFIFAARGLIKEKDQLPIPWVEGINHKQVSRYLTQMIKLGIIEIKVKGTNHKFHDNKATTYIWKGYDKI